MGGIWYGSQHIPTFLPDLRVRSVKQILFHCIIIIVTWHGLPLSLIYDTASLPQSPVHMYVADPSSMCLNVWPVACRSSGYFYMSTYSLILSVIKLQFVILCIANKKTLSRQPPFQWYSILLKFCT